MSVVKCRVKLTCKSMIPIAQGKSFLKPKIFITRSVAKPLLMVSASTSCAVTELR
ncbi:Uncharacterised protein [Vibrio cholerae]|nr:Uncharacterised protein [Vibrio cholerae]